MMGKNCFAPSVKTEQAFTVNVTTFLYVMQSICVEACSAFLLELGMLSLIFERVPGHTQQLTLLFDPYSIGVLSKANLPVDDHALTAVRGLN